MNLRLYGVALGRARGPLGLGLDGERLRRLAVGRLRAVIGRAAPDAGAPGTGAILAYDRIVRRLAAKHEAFLPARLQSASLTGEALRAQLSADETALVRRLLEVRGCEQMTLRLYREGPAARPASPSTRPGAGPGERYLRARHGAWKVATELPELAPLRAALGDDLRGERVRPHGELAPPLVATVCHLVPRGRALAYARAVRRLERALDGWRLVPSGPWPAYAFGPEPLA
ncbi:MAG: GvpL/GvpF family gas vesicle protein [Deltaproteobacteria bacterium]